MNAPTKLILPKQKLWNLCTVFYIYANEALQTETIYTYKYLIKYLQMTLWLLWDAMTTIDLKYKYVIPFYILMALITYPWPKLDFALASLSR